MCFIYCNNFAWVQCSSPKFKDILYSGFMQASKCHELVNLWLGSVTQHRYVDFTSFYRPLLLSTLLRFPFGEAQSCKLEVTIFFPTFFNIVFQHWYWLEETVLGEYCKIEGAGSLSTNLKISTAPKHSFCDVIADLYECSVALYE